MENIPHVNLLGGSWLKLCLTCCFFLTKGTCVCLVSFGWLVPAMSKVFGASHLAAALLYKVRRTALIRRSGVQSLIDLFDGTAVTL